MKRIISTCTLSLLIFTIISTVSVTAENAISVEEINICTQVTDRQPVDSAVFFPCNIDKLYCWTKITGVMSGTETVKHVWYYNDREMSSISLNISGSPWRTWSSKTIISSWQGQWTVKILDSQDNLLKEINFEVTKDGEILEKITRKDEEKVTKEILDTIEEVKTTVKEGESELSIQEIYICESVENREPVNNSTSFPSSIEKLYCWIKIIGVKEPIQIKHIWYYNGKEISSVSLNVGGSPWRTWSSKTMQSLWTGDWKVKIVDENDVLLNEIDFQIVE